MDTTKSSMTNPPRESPRRVPVRSPQASHVPEGTRRCRRRAFGPSWVHDPGESWVDGGTDQCRPATDRPLLAPSDSGE